MSKTKELTIICDEVKVTPNSYGKVRVETEGIEVDDILHNIEHEDLIEYIKDHLSPEELFPTSELEKWAESEGYTRHTEGFI